MSVKLLQARLDFGGANQLLDFHQNPKDTKENSAEGQKRKKKKRNKRKEKKNRSNNYTA